MSYHIFKKNSQFVFSTVNNVEPLGTSTYWLVSQDSKSSLLSFLGLKVLTFIFHRTQSPHFLFHRTQSPLSFTFERLSQSFVLQRQSRSFAPLLFKDYHSLFSCGDNQGHPLFYFSKTITSFVLWRQSRSSASLLYKDYHSLLFCRDNQGHLPLYFLKTTMSFD